MKKLLSIVTVVILITTALLVFVACNKDNKVDYVSQLKLDQSSPRARLEVTVKYYIDGDTAHFNVPTSVEPTGVLKVRFLAINTPESTSKIEEYGNKASKFTRGKLESAKSIIIESEGSTWEPDSTGTRYLAWVWYRTENDVEYRNLNLEILQEGLAVASNTANSLYGNICMKALNQARELKLNVYSGEPDPDMYYGDAQVITMKELRTNLSSYANTKVAVEGIVTSIYDNSAYLQDFDEDTGMYYGIACFYGYTPGMLMNLLKLGNRVSLVGTVKFYENGGYYQITDPYYDLFPTDKDALMTSVVSTGNEIEYLETTADKFVNGKVEVVVNDVKAEYPYNEMAMNTAILMKDLLVTHVSVTESENAGSDGAMTLTCKQGNVTVSVRTRVFRDEDGNLIGAEVFENKTIDVRGMVEYFSTAQKYQIKIVSFEDITIK